MFAAKASNFPVDPPPTSYFFSRAVTDNQTKEESSLREKRDENSYEARIYSR